MWKFALSLVLVLAAGRLSAQEFQYEAQPLFEACGEASLSKAQRDGITLGISPSPPYSSLDPNSGKAAGLDVTPDRLKAVSFTGPAWWYGPAIVVQKGNPQGLTSFEALKGKRIGAIAG